MDESAHQARCRKLTFRAWRRGFREMDLLMGSFADAHLAELDEAGLSEFERLLSTPDWDVYAWIIGQKQVPEIYQSPLLNKLIAFRFEAQPG